MILKITFFGYFWLLFFVNGVRSWSWSCMQMYLYLKVWANQVTPGFWEEASTTRDITFRWRQMSIKASHFSGHSNVLFAASNIKENIKARHYWPFCEGNPPVTDGFPSQRASNVESVSMAWCHHILRLPLVLFHYLLTRLKIDCHQKISQNMAVLLPSLHGMGCFLLKFLPWKCN